MGAMGKWVDLGGGVEDIGNEGGRGAEGSIVMACALTKET
jgi:hypothetical protein